MTSSTTIEGPMIDEVDMGGVPSDSSSTNTVRVTVVQASTVFYDTPATLGIKFYPPFLFLFSW